MEQLHALVWTGLEERHGLYWVRSTDGGDSWSEPQRMGGELARNADMAKGIGDIRAAYGGEVIFPEELMSFEV